MFKIQDSSRGLSGESAAHFIAVFRTREFEKESESKVGYCFSLVSGFEHRNGQQKLVGKHQRYPLICCWCAHLSRGPILGYNN